MFEGEIQNGSFSKLFLLTRLLISTLRREILVSIKSNQEFRLRDSRFVDKCESFAQIASIMGVSTSSYDGFQ